MTDGVEITDSTELTIGTVVGTAAKTLTLPKIPVKIGTVNGANMVTIAAGTGGGTTMALDIAKIEGELTLPAADVVLASGAQVEVASGGVLKSLATDFTPFTNLDGLASKVSGDGKVDLSALTGGLSIPAGFTKPFSVGIDLGAADLTLLGDATFNKSLNVTNVTNAGSTGSSKLTLNGLTAIANTLTSDGSGATDALTIAGTGKVTVADIVTATKPLVIENTHADGVAFNVAGSTNVIADTVYLEVKNGAKLVAGANLVFGPGKYTAAGTGVTYGNSIITLGAGTDSLTFGNIVLGGTGATTFTASAHPVTLGMDNGKGIINIADGALALATNGVLALGDGGKITFLNTGALSGLTAGSSGTATPGAKNDSSFQDATYDSGITVGPSGANLGYATGTLTATGEADITGSSPNGGVFTPSSDLTKL
jgi:hypothetical protein